MDAKIILFLLSLISTGLAQDIEILGEFQSFRDGSDSPVLSYSIRLNASLSGEGVQFVECFPCVTGSDVDGTPLVSWIRATFDGSEYREMRASIRNSEEIESMEFENLEGISLNISREPVRFFSPETLSSGLQFFPQFIEVTDAKVSLMDLVSVEKLDDLLPGVKNWSRESGLLRIDFGCSSYELSYDDASGLPFAPKRLVERRNTCREAGRLVGESVWSDPKTFPTMFGKISMPTHYERTWHSDETLLVRDVFVIHSIRIEPVIPSPFSVPQEADADIVRRSE